MHTTFFHGVAEERDAIPPARADRGVDVGRVVERPVLAIAEEMHRAMVAAQPREGAGAVQLEDRVRREHQVKARTIMVGGQDEVTVEQVDNFVLDVWLVHLVWPGSRPE